MLQLSNIYLPNDLRFEIHLPQNIEQTLRKFATDSDQSMPPSALGNTSVSTAPDIAKSISEPKKSPHRVISPVPVPAPFPVRVPAPLPVRVPAPLPVPVPAPLPDTARVPPKTAVQAPRVMATRSSSARQRQQLEERQHIQLEMEAAIAPVTRENSGQNANASKKVNDSDIVSDSVDFVRHEAALHRRRAEMATNKLRVNKARMDMLKKDKQQRGDDDAEIGNAAQKKSIRTHMFE